MDFLIADTFTAAFSRLSSQDQKAVKASVFDLQMDPVGNGLQLHRIDKSKDPNFWSARVNRDVRLIVHKTGDSMLVAYVDHHDPAYAWAERRRIEAHPRTGAVQIVEVRERVEDIAPPETFDFIMPEFAATAVPQASLFASLADDALLSIGVPGQEGHRERRLDDLPRALPDDRQGRSRAVLRAVRPRLPPDPQGEPQEQPPGFLLPAADRPQRRRAGSEPARVDDQPVSE